MLEDIINHLDRLPGNHDEEDYVAMLKSIAKDHKLSLGKVMKVCRHVITGGKVRTLRGRVSHFNNVVNTGRTKGSYSYEHNGT